MGSSFIAAPPPSLRECFSSLFLWVREEVSISPHVPNCKSLLFQNKPILLEKCLAIGLRPPGCEFHIFKKAHSRSFAK